MSTIRGNVSKVLNSGFTIGNLQLKNRIVRSATYEGASDHNGVPNSLYQKMYENLAKNQVGMIITGFSYISRLGKAMQTAQSGIDTPDKIEAYKEITSISKSYNCPMIMQIAHTGRQTLESETYQMPVSSSTKKSVYFRQSTQLASIDDIKLIIEQFTNSALFAKNAGFDGIQLHCGHGYLLHQFLLTETNKLYNEYGIDRNTDIGTLLLEEVIDKTREKCGEEFPILVKISGNHDLSTHFYPDKFTHLIKFLDKKKVSAIEISYGTMDYALNIFRGELNLNSVFKYNPIFNRPGYIKRNIQKFYINNIIKPKFKSFAPMYNLEYASKAKEITEIPIISVGGFRTRDEMESALVSKKADLVSMSRPFICEPDFARKVIESEENYISKCTNCNECVFMCDSGRVTKCYSKNHLFII